MKSNGIKYDRLRRKEPRRYDNAANKKVDQTSKETTIRTFQQVGWSYDTRQAQLTPKSFAVSQVSHPTTGESDHTS